MTDDRKRQITKAHLAAFGSGEPKKDVFFTFCFPFLTLAIFILFLQKGLQSRYLVTATSPEAFGNCFKM